MNFVIGTAGHVDHGKSSLIRALTGIDPDRLAEEKRRGMTIDLGFAHLQLPSGREVGIVDVPGHARFIGNMLAGVHGLDLVLLVIAADEGVMPQTVEHLDIVTLLGVGRGVVALSKSDLVDEEWLAMVEADVQAALAETPLREAPIVRVSSVSGRGLEDLQREMDRALDLVPRRPPSDRPRLPVDRVFTLAGFGTVVTGTLVDGMLRVGDELEVQPSGRRVRIRGLHRHDRPVTEVEEGSRAAANIVGVEKTEIGRGDVLARPRALSPTARLECSLTVLGNARPVRNGASVVFHAGTAEVPARVTVLGADRVDSGRDGFVRLSLAHPVAVLNGDRYVLRLPSPAETLAGGRVLDTAPRRHSRQDAAAVEALGRRLEGAFAAEELRRHPLGVARAEVTALGDDRLPDGTVEIGDWLFAGEAWSALESRTAKLLAAYHRAHPLRPGMPREELRTRLRVRAPFSAVLERLASTGTIALVDGVVALPSHSGAMIPDVRADRLKAVLGEEPLAPPSVSEALRQSGADEEVLGLLVRSGEVVRVSDEVAFTRSAYDSALELVRRTVADEGSVTVAALRDRMGASRRPVLALLERLDAERITRRVGDVRVLVER